MKSASRPVTALCAALSLASALASIAVAGEDPPAERRRRWGFGWDSGIAARHYVTPNWGLGFRVNPNIGDESGDGDDFDRYSYSSYVSDEVYARREERVNWGVGIIAFAESDIHRSIRIGPYGGVTYSYASDTTEEKGAGHRQGEGEPEDSVYGVRYSSIVRSATAQAGIRPVILIGKRLRLETRIGAVIVFRNRDSDRRHFSHDALDSTADVDESRSHFDSEEWQFFTVGSDEILYTDVQIIFMF